MRSLRIPPKLREGLKEIALLDENSFEEVLLALRDSPLRTSPMALSGNLSPLVKSISRDKVDEISGALFGIQLGFLNSEVSLDAFIADVSAALSKGNKDGRGLAAEHLEKLSDRLGKLMTTPSIAVGAKAQNILFEHERNLIEARIITDFRPVFGDKPTAEPVGGIVIHNLKITYIDNDEEKDFFVAMDSKDLQKLIDTLKRAQEKDQSLRSLMGKANVPVIEPE